MTGTFSTNIPYSKVEGAVPLIVLGVVLNFILGYYINIPFLQVTWTGLIFVIVYAAAIWLVWYFSLSLWNNVFDKKNENDYFVIIYIVVLVLVPALAYEVAVYNTLSFLYVWEFLAANWLQYLIVNLISLIICINALR